MLSRTLFSIPGLRGRLPAPPLGAFPQGATLFESGEGPPLEEKTSAACGVGPDSIADALAVGCPVSPFFASTAWLGVLPGEERAHPARPALPFWALSGPNVCVGCLGADAVQSPCPWIPTPVRKTLSITLHCTKPPGLSREVFISCLIEESTGIYSTPASCSFFSVFHILRNSFSSAFVKILKGTCTTLSAN